MIKKVFFSLATVCFIICIAYALRVYELHSTAPLTIIQVSGIAGLMLTAGLFVIKAVSLADEKNYGNMAVFLMLSGSMLLFMYFLAFGAMYANQGIKMSWIDACVIGFLVCCSTIFVIVGLILRVIKNEQNEMQKILDHFHGMESIFMNLQNDFEHNKDQRGDYVLAYFKFIDMVRKYQNEEHLNASKLKVAHMFELTQEWERQIREM
ncbi:MAG: hypothetical protein IKE91_07815 [Clostridia bacterium]|nr:hypothetical protein [Clostridia bacterium]